MHIDNLVFKVRPEAHPIKLMTTTDATVRTDKPENGFLSWLLWFPRQVMEACQKQEAIPSVGGGRFSCATSDVLSGVMHVISRGCARRNEENPHFVEFLPEDPPTPQKGQAQFSFSRNEFKKDSTHSVADIRCEHELQ